MMIVNGVSRYHVAIDAVERGTKANEELKNKVQELVTELKKRQDDTSKYILENGVDVDGTYDTPAFD